MKAATIGAGARRPLRWVAMHRDGHRLTVGVLRGIGQPAMCTVAPVFGPPSTGEHAA